MASRRQRRVSELVQQELAELIAFEVKDPRLDFVSVTTVAMSADLRYADVYVSSVTANDEAEGNEVVAALDHAGGFLRRALGQRIRLRQVPELRFHFDRGLLAGRRIEALLGELEQSQETPQPADDDPA